MCKHETFRVVGTPVGFFRSLGDNPAARGSVEVTEMCTCCGAERKANRNGSHHEPGPWGPSAADRQAAAYRREVEAVRAEDAAVTRHGVELLDVLPHHRRVQVRLAGRPAQWVTLDELDAAGAQPDDGHGASVLYRGIARMVRRRIAQELASLEPGTIVR